MEAEKVQAERRAFSPSYSSSATHERKKSYGQITRRHHRKI